MDDILNFKRELEILKNDKESQEKTALQEAASLRSRIQVMIEFFVFVLYVIDWQ